MEKVLNVQRAGAKIALITDSNSGGDDFIGPSNLTVRIKYFRTSDMVSDDGQRRADIPSAWLPGVSG